MSFFMKYSGFGQVTKTWIPKTCYEDLVNEYMELFWKPNILLIF